VEGYDVYDVLIGSYKLNYSMSDGSDPVKKVEFYDENYKKGEVFFSYIQI
jgi:hypothetical protein